MTFFFMPMTKVYFFQHKDINIIEHLLNRNFSNICDWFVDNKFSIYFGEDNKIHSFCSFK